jgi:hypothetical protein
VFNKYEKVENLSDLMDRFNNIATDVLNAKGDNRGINNKFAFDKATINKEKSAPSEAQIAAAANARNHRVHEVTEVPEPVEEDISQQVA